MIDLVGDRSDFPVGEAQHLIAENTLFLREV